MFRPHWVCPVQECLCFPVYTAQAPGCSIWSGPCVDCGSSFRVLHKSADSVALAFCAFPGLSISGSQGLGRTLPGFRCTFSPRFGAPSPLCGHFRARQWGACALCLFSRGSWPLATTLPAGVASLGLSLPLAPPPASYLQWGWAGSSLQFLSPFVLRTAGGVFLLVNFSFALPQTLRNSAGSSPFRPYLLGAGAGVWGTFLLGVAFRPVI